MTLREFLDNVRFGNVSRLCIATPGKDDFLQNYDEGRYWELPSGNWADGSNSTIEPEFPDEMMSAEVIEIDASPNLRDIYANLGRLGSNSRDTTVILVRAPRVFDEDAYWEEEDTWEPTVSMDMHEWAYNISKKSGLQFANWRAAGPYSKWLSIIFWISALIQSRSTPMKTLKTWTTMMQESCVWRVRLH